MGEINLMEVSHMKRFILSVLVFALMALFTGCSSTVQTIAAPDMNKPIPKDKSIIELERSSSIFGAARSPYVYANKKLIGELGNGGTLVWSTKSNQLECLHLEFNRTPGFDSNFVWDERPLSYQCFTTTSGKILKLGLDFIKGRFHKKDATSLKDTFQITKINDTSKSDTKYDISELLKNAIVKELGNNIVVDNPSKTIDIFIEEYQEGNAASRWLTTSLAGSTLLKVRVVTKKHNEIIDTYIVRVAVAEGGLFSVGADKQVLDYTGKDIAKYLLGK